MTTISTAFDVTSEFVGADFGDRRLSARLVRLGQELVKGPDRSLPKVLANRSQLEAAYRFFSHDRVQSDNILEPHFEQTRDRIEQAQLALVLHDTTQLVFDGDRQGLGRLHGAGSAGFLFHCSLAVTIDRRPLGVMASRTWVRRKPPRRKTRNGHRRSGFQYGKLHDKESARWGEQIEQCEQRIEGRAQLIHIADREADAYQLLRELQGRRFVIRARNDRCIQDEDDEATLLSQACQSPGALIEFAVPVTKRVASPAPATAKAHPPREERIARVQVHATTVTLRRPPQVAERDAVEVNVVYAHEVDAPADVEPLQWVLYTSERIDTVQAVLAVVEYYRTRWVIEQYFKALKSGCEIQKLQLESYQSLTNALAVYVPIAWAILLLRTLARAQPDAPAHRVLSSTQIAVLQALGRFRLSPAPTAHQVMMAVAQLGGHVQHAKPPGYIVLARGMQDLLMLERGWLAAKQGKDVMDA